MAITDFPRMPGELNVRIGELKKKMKEGEIPMEKVKEKALTAMGRFRIDKNGMNTFGEFGKIEFDSDDLKAMMESAENFVDFMSILIGKEFYIKSGNKIEKIRLGIPFKPKEVNEIPEEEEEDVPVVEFKADENGKYPEHRLALVLDFFKKRFGDKIDVAEPGFVIHQYEGFAGWFKDYEELTKGLDAAIPLLELTTKKKIIKTGESLFLLIGDVLTRCGV